MLWGEMMMRVERIDANGEENRRMCCCTKVTDLFDKKEEETRIYYLIYEKVKR
jgi:hypothetical protein